MKQFSWVVSGMLAAASLAVPARGQELAVPSGKGAKVQDTAAGASSISTKTVGPNPFEKADTNGDGKLSLEEFKAAFAKGNPEERFAAADADRDGFVTQEELRVGQEKAAEAAALEMFKKADTNGDGKLSLEEFKAVYSAKGNAEERFAHADADKDGFVTADELKAKAVRAKPADKPAKSAPVETQPGK